MVCWYWEPDWGLADQPIARVSSASRLCINIITMESGVIVSSWDPVKDQTRTAANIPCVSSGQQHRLNKVVNVCMRARTGQIGPTTQLSTRRLHSQESYLNFRCSDSFKDEYEFSSKIWNQKFRNHVNQLLFLLILQRSTQECLRILANSLVYLKRSILRCFKPKYWEKFNVKDSLNIVLFSNQNRSHSLVWYWTSPPISTFRLILIV